VIARELASYYLHRRVEMGFVNRPNIRLVTYESMRSDKERVLRDVCAFLDLEFHPGMLDDAFPPNTSYKRSRPEEILTKADVGTFKLLRPLVSALPLPLLRRLQHGRVRPGPRKGERLLVAGAFKTFRREVEAARAAEVERPTVGGPGG